MEYMIRQIEGVAAHIEDGTVVVDVGGIGYLVHLPALPQNLSLGARVTFHTHLAVRENALDLYGFIDRDSLEVFELLITLPKIGPKSALQILRQADIALLKQAVLNDDASYLSKMSGIGKKSAEKIVAGLKDKFEHADAGAYLAQTDGEDNSYVRDTIDALVSLGYPESDARKTVRQLAETNPEIATSPEALKAALKVLSG